MSLSGADHAPSRALLDQAIGLHRDGRIADALAVYDRILANNPEDADALNLSGLARLSQGDAAGAVTLIARAVRRVPKSPMFQFNLGTAQAAAGLADKAIVSFERATKLKPDMAEAWAALGLARAGRGEERKAAHALRRAVAIEPRLAEAWNNLALVLGRLGETVEARRAVENAIAARPDFAVAHNSAGALAREAGDIGASIAELEYAAALDPSYFEARSNLGVSLTEAGRHDDAIGAFKAALALRSDHAETWRAAAKPLTALGRLDEARAACDRALALAPRDRRTVWEKALIDLASGHFEAGWDGYRARSMVDRGRRPVPQQRLGPDLTGRALVLEGEQGLGEELFFLRFATLLKQRGARLIARVDTRLVPLVARMESIDDVVARDTGSGAKGNTEALLLGDVPWLAGAGDGALPPAAIPAVEALRRKVQARLALAGPPPYVALTWRAGISGRTTLFKEAPVTLIADALRDGMAGQPATLIALQRAPRAEEIASVASAIGRPVADFTDLNDDLQAMHALMFEIGDYVAVSNTNVHLAAAARAAGAPVRAHVLVPCPAEFRWLAAGAESPWFPGFSVHREEAREGWTAARISLARAISGAISGI